MTTEQLDKIAWLNRAFHANMKLKSLRAYKRSKQYDIDVSGVNYENTGVSNGKNENTVELKIQDHCDIVSDIDKKIKAQEIIVKSLEDEICNAIYAIGDDKYESILICRHLACLKTESAAKEINYSVRNSARIYSEALNRLSCFGTECP